MALRDSPPFKQFGYWPNTPSQWREPTVDDCTWYAGEFAFQAADDRHRNFHPVKDFRIHSADNTGGTTIEYMMKFMGKRWPDNAKLVYAYGSFNEQSIVEILQQGGTFVVGGHYDNLPRHYKRWTNSNNFNHAIAVRFYDEKTERVAMYDPLGGGVQRAPYDGEWIKLETLLNGFWWTGGKGWVAGAVTPQKEGRFMKPTIDFETAATRAVRLRKGSRIRSEPSALSSKQRTVWSDNKLWPTIGRIDGFALVTWKDAEDNWKWGYVHRTNILEEVDVQPDTPAAPSDAQATIDKLAAAYDNLKETSDARLGIINKIRNIVN